MPRRVAGTLLVVAMLGTSLSAAAAAAEELAVPSNPPGALALTPAQATGPYYPVERPLDSDDDLMVVSGGPEALGEPLILEGTLVHVDGRPIEGAHVEIWQTDHQGIYLHPDDPQRAARDELFQGFGESVTDASGAWSFRTILPDIYGGRPRHIHARVKLDGQDLLITQIYFSGGDIPQDGAVALTGTELDRLIVEAVRVPLDDGAAILTARHRLVVP